MRRVRMTRNTQNTLPYLRKLIGKYGTYETGTTYKNIIVYFPHKQIYPALEKVQES
jgi:hypothetical protein